jgi:hypothetical protein
MSKKIDPWNGAQCHLCPRDTDGYYPEWVQPDALDALRQHLTDVHQVVATKQSLIMHLTHERYYRRDDALEIDGKRVGVYSYIVPREKGEML